jgi:hypothetical protein
MPCYVVQYDSQLPKARINLWVVPRVNHAVTRITSDSLDDKERVVSSVETSYRQYKKTDLWYPETCEMKMNVDDALFHHEMTRVSDVRLNADCDPHAFELQNLDLPNGTPILNRNGGTRLQVKDGKVEVMQRAEMRDLPQPIAPPPNTTWWFVTGAFGAVGMLLCVYALLRRKTNTNV